MRFGLYVKSLARSRGTERVIAGLAGGLTERGHRVDLLVEDPRVWLPERLRSREGIRVVDLRAGPPSARLNALSLGLAVARALLRDPRACFGLADGSARGLFDLAVRKQPPILALRRYLRRERPDAVLSFLDYANLSLLLAAQGLRGKTRFLVSVRNHVSTAVRRRDSRGMRGVPHSMRRLFPRADAVVAVSHGIADDVAAITGLPRGDITTIYNPSFESEIVAQSREPAGHPWLDDARSPVVLGAGKLKPQKDFASLIRAFALVRSERPARLVILGEGPERAALTDLAAELGVSADVDLPGHVANPYPFFRGASVFVLSSAWEGLPNVLIESLALGCPVVSTDCPSGPAEILEHGAVGRLVGVGDVQAIARSILETLESPPDQEKLVERARFFSRERSIARFEQVLAGRSVD